MAAVSECIQTNCFYSQDYIEEHLTGLNNSDLQEWLRIHCRECSTQDKRRKRDNITKIAKTYMETMAPEMLRESLLMLSFPDILKVCATNKAMSKVCDDDAFWSRYFTTRPSQMTDVFLLALRQNNQRFADLVQSQPGFVHQFRTSGGSALLSQILGSGMDTITHVDMQRYILQLSPVLFDEIDTKKRMMNELLESNMMTIKTAELQREIMDMDNDVYEQKTIAMTGLLKNVNHLETAEVQRYLIDRPSSDFHVTDDSIKQRGMDSMLRNGLMHIKTSELQSYILQKRRDQFFNQGLAITHLMEFGFFNSLLTRQLKQEVRRLYSRMHLGGIMPYNY